MCACVMSICLPDNAIGLNGPIGATDCASEFNALVIIGDVVLTPCGMNGKLGKPVRLAAAAAAAAAAAFDPISAKCNADAELAIDDLLSERGVRSSAPCDKSDGDGDT